MSEITLDDWYHPENATFGDRLAGAREAAGLSQEELAQALGVKVKTLRNWENDLSEPRANRLSMMAGLLNVSFRWLLVGEGRGVAGPDTEQAGSAEVRKILSEMRDLRRVIQHAGEELAQLETRMRLALSVTGEE